jgi:addiction module HigA family antidote
MIERITHPGIFIREHVIPSGMSVKDAAKRLGVGRPALSNLLNGNSALSPEMAVRLEKAFGADRQKLLDLQATFDQHERRGGEKVVAVRVYVPSFLTIRARQIHDWPENNVEVRKLVHSAGHELRQVDFPGYDNAEGKGWDGLIEATAATPWIPEGKSCWEFGTNKDPGAKAERDYAARLSSVSPTERANVTLLPQDGDPASSLEREPSRHRGGTARR